MSIKVTTPDHGVQVLDANDWEIRNEDLPNGGSLWVGKGDTGVAEFAKGSWLFVVETVDETGPRVWKSLRDIPIGVVFADRDGDVWKSERWRIEELKRGERLTVEYYAPFTEVVE